MTPMSADDPRFSWDEITRKGGWINTDKAIERIKQELGLDSRDALVALCDACEARCIAYYQEDDGAPTVLERHFEGWLKDKKEGRKPKIRRTEEGEHLLFDELWIEFDPGAN